MEIIGTIPPNLVNFILVTLFSLLIGLSQRRIHTMANEVSHTFGTDRTFTFIGILGFILYLLDGSSPVLFMGGGLVLAMVMGISYFYHIRDLKDFGATTIFVALITYCLGPLILTQPLWMVLLIVVTVLILTELKETFATISQKFDRYEFITLAKFFIIAGVILPVLPDGPFIKGLSLTPYKIWLAIVVISSISYCSYLLRKFIFPNASIILSGILGGLYSSTATTIILAKKSRSEPQHLQQYMAGIIFATAVMYLRILILIFIFSQPLFMDVWLCFLGLFLLTVIIGLVVLLYRNRMVSTPGLELPADRNPLEFKVSLIFATLYVAFTFITYEVLTKYGTPGLNWLSCLVGMTDIDPFLINLFQGKYGVPLNAVIIATLQAIVSNNVLKMVYGSFFAAKSARVYLIPGFLLIIAFTIAAIVIVY
ncbi:MAG: MgtC/SapB family protein [Bacteroidales bacterium]